MLADDTSILITNNSQDELLQRFKHVYNHMPKWFQADLLTFKPTKTKVLKFTSTKLPSVLNLTYADQLVLVVEVLRLANG
jgi:alpha-N-acetylglucosamine transferase